MIRVYVAKKNAVQLEFTGHEFLSMKTAKEFCNDQNRRAQMRKTDEVFVALNQPKKFGEQAVEIATDSEASEEDKERALDRLILQNGY